MRRYGDPIVVRFGDNPDVTGYSMFQLIETSNLAGHFAEATNAAYLDIFSCQEYDPNVVVDFCIQTFKAERAHGRFVLRD
jgi:S-adenosylmethionine/arginine decarboxylase-like enzyme